MLRSLVNSFGDLSVQLRATSGSNRRPSTSTATQCTTGLFDRVDPPSNLTGSSSSTHFPSQTSGLSFNFLSMPPELGLEIISQILFFEDEKDQEKTLKTLRSVCKAFRELASPYLFSKVFISNRLGVGDLKEELPKRYLVRTEEIHIIIFESDLMDGLNDRTGSGISGFKLEECGEEEDEPQYHVSIRRFLRWAPNLLAVYVHFRHDDRYHFPVSENASLAVNYLGSLLSILNSSNHPLYLGFLVESELEDFGVRIQDRMAGCMNLIPLEVKENICGVKIDVFSLHQNCFKALLTFPNLTRLELGASYLLVGINSVSNIQQPIKELIIYNTDADDGRVSWGRVRWLLSLCAHSLETISIRHSVQFSPIERHIKASPLILPRLKKFEIENGAMDDDPTDLEDPSHWRRLHCLLSAFAFTPIEELSMDEVFFRLKGFTSQVAAADSILMTIRQHSKLGSFEAPRTSPFEILAAFILFVIGDQKRDGRWEKLKVLRLGNELEKSLMRSRVGREYRWALVDLGVKVQDW